MISYSTNFMGPVNMEWFRERGLTEIVSEVLEEDHKFSGLKKGQIFDYEKITTYYSAGRIDIYGVPGEHYPMEYGLAPMHGEDWNALSEWLDGLETDELMSYGDLIESFQLWYGKSIRWADDTWYRCWECGLITDLRKTKQHQHKMDCTRTLNK